MALEDIKKLPYEISVWKEEVLDNGKKKETKLFIIGAHDMTYEGRATSVKFTRKLNGTNSLTFQMPDKYFDSREGKYVRNKFIDELFSERKIKLFYKEKWYELYIKTIKEDKKFKSYMKTYTCSDSFIDELSRNGYGITFDEELYNNVEEIGTFSETVLDGSLWTYTPQYNWGDFTEFTPTKLFKIPISQFKKLSAYKINFQLDNLTITNAETGEIRKAEMGDDLAREKGIFWKNNYEEVSLSTNLNDYIFVPYTQLDFCYSDCDYKNISEIKDKYDLQATEEAQYYPNTNYYALAPRNVDPNNYIQFIYFPKNQKLKIDETGLILDKTYHYFMTTRQWNENIKSDYWYIFEDTQLTKGLASGTDSLAYVSHTFKYIAEDFNVIDTYKECLGNKCVYYDGYLSNLNDLAEIKGKSISIANRSELNITEEIDQFTTVYSENSSNFNDNFSNPDWWGTTENYQVCSKIDTRQIVPQLARNYIQNGVNIQSTDGWEVQNLVSESESMKFDSAKVQLRSSRSDSNNFSSQTELSFLYYTPPRYPIGYVWKLNSQKYNQLDSQLKTVFSILTDAQRQGYFFSNGTYFMTKKNNNEESYQIIFYLDELYNENDISSTGQINKKNYNKIKRCFEPVKYFTSGNKQQIRYLYPTKKTNNSGVPQLNFSLVVKYRNGTQNNELTIDKNMDLETGTIVNFGIIGQEKKIEKDKIYCLNISCFTKSIDNLKIIIGKGISLGEGKYTISERERIEFTGRQFANSNNVDNIWDYGDSIQFIEDANYPFKVNNDTLSSRTFLFKTKKDIENPFFAIENPNLMLINKVRLFEAYTKGADQFTNNNIIFKYSGRNLFTKDIPSENLYWYNNENYDYSSFITEKSMRNLVIFDDDIMPGGTFEIQNYFIQQLVLKDSAILNNLEELDKICRYNDKIKEKYVQEYNIMSDYINDGAISKILIHLQKYYNESSTVKIQNFVAANMSQNDLRKRIIAIIIKFFLAHYDTFNQKEFLSDNGTLEHLPLDSSKITEDDYEIITNYIDLGTCEYYKSNTSVTNTDCSYGNGNHTCYYQKFGYCPYRFHAMQHCRKIRTLKGEKSNRFNLTQEISKVFECYPVYSIKHNSIGKAETNADGSMIKNLYYITEKGKNNPYGFRYEKNLSNISRTIQSDKIVTKLYVDDVDSDISSTGLCSIKTALDNPSKDSFILDFSYYTAKGLLNQQQVESDLYGNGSNSGYLKTLGYYNNEYDKLSNKIINLESESYTELESKLIVNLEGIETAKKQLRKYQVQIDKYSSLQKPTATTTNAANDNLLNYQIKIDEQLAIFNQLVSDTFFTNNTNGEQTLYVNGLTPLKWYDSYMNHIDEWRNEHTYSAGILGQFNKEYLQIQEWKKQRSKFLKLINKLSTDFFKKYEPFLKEGTWSDSNYISDNAYYHGALEVAAQGAIPKVSYTISVNDLSSKPEYKYYELDIADSTFVEDIGMFGVNPSTGLPNHLKVLVSETTDDLDDNSKNSIKIQDFTTQFEDLFQQVTATVQSLSYNENIYRRSSNFTALQNISEQSLQGALDSNNLTLVNTKENNITIDNQGQSGSDLNNHNNKYKINGQGIFFSNTGGTDWTVGVTPQGINADCIKTGTLDAGKIRITDSGYLYFSWDKSGINAYRDPLSTNNTNYLSDRITFNRAGLSLVQGNKVRLRAGYEYNGVNGDFINNESITDNQSIGFYLYDNNGRTIFSTSNGESTSARISLLGEMYASNNIDDETKSTGIYINNKSGINSDGYRLLSIVKGNGNNAINLFTVDSNGTLYIGGRISNAYTNGLLNDELSIENAPIQMDSGGNVKMNYEIMQSQNGTALGQYVADKVASSEIKGIKLSTEKIDLDESINEYSEQLIAGSFISNSGGYILNDSAVNNLVNMSAAVIKLFYAVREIKNDLNNKYVLTSPNVTLDF